MRIHNTHTLDREVAVLDKDLGGLLVGVGSIAESQLLGAGGVLLAEVVRDRLVVL